MKPLLLTLLIIFGVVIVVGLGSVLMVLWAYGSGQVMLRILPSHTFSPFEATLLNLVGVLIVGLLVVRIVTSATANPLSSGTFTDEEFDDVDREDDEELEDEEEEYEEDDDDQYPGIPRWRRPLKKIDFSNVKPNDLCPCGSGRKYKNCHGYKRTEVK